MALERVYDYFHHYDKQTYQVVACMGNEPTEQDIKSFEYQYGIALPAEFREIYDVASGWFVCGGAGRNLAKGEAI